MKIFTKNLLYAVLFFAVISALFSLVRTPAETAEEVALSRLATQVNEGIVKEIIVEGSNLSVVLNDDKKETTKKESEASLTESLKNYGVDSEKLRSVNITMQEPSGALFWLGAILPFLLPFLSLRLLRHLP